MTNPGYWCSTCLTSLVRLFSLLYRLNMVDDPRVYCGLLLHLGPAYLIALIQTRCLTSTEAPSVPAILPSSLFYLARLFKQTCVGMSACLRVSEYRGSRLHSVRVQKMIPNQVLRGESNLVKWHIIAPAEF